MVEPSPTSPTLFMCKGFCRRMGKARRQSKLVRLIATPIRVLGKARDLYVRSIMSCADSGNYGYAVGYHGVDSVAFPKSFSVGSDRSCDGDDFKELVKTASVKSLGNGVEVDVILQEHLSRSVCKIGSNDLPKSCSVQMGRIDEDKTCEFGEDDGIPRAAYPRSKSCAVPRRVGR